MLDWHVLPIVRVARIVVVAVFVAPWVLLAVVNHVIRCARALVGLRRSVTRALASHLPCPRGHRSAMHGVWECRGCGGLVLGYAFACCPVCGSSAGHVTCEHCGLAVKNPFL